MSGPTTYASKDEAKTWVAAVRVDVSKGTWVAPAKGATTFAEWADIYWTLLELRENTREDSILRYGKHIKPKWGDLALADITPLMVAHWIGELKANPGLADSTVRLVYFTFHKMMRWAVSPGGLIPRSPCPDKPQLPEDHPRQVVPLTADEIERLANLVRERWTALIWTLAYGGFRISEAAALRVNDLDFDKATIRVDEKIAELSSGRMFQPFLKSRRGWRVVAMPWGVMDLLAQHVSKYTDGTSEALVFTGRLGAPITLRNWADEQLAPYAVMIGRPDLTPHSFRHTAVSMWISYGASIKQVADRAGCTIKTIERTYAHMFPGDEERLRDAMDTAIRGRQALPAAVGSNVVHLRPKGR